jgi:hypothetical protein
VAKWRVLTDTVDFSNIVKKSALERLAEADDHEVVRGIVECFADFIVINPDLCSVPLNARVFSSSPDAWNHDGLTRTTEGVLALLLSLKKKPLIRFERNSVLCRKLATEVRYAMAQEEQLFDFGRRPDTPPILLLVDRREDAVTPLLTQWTYQAMVHELLGIENGRVDLSHAPDVRPEFKASYILYPSKIGGRANKHRKSSSPKTKTPSSPKTCTSTSATWARTPRTTSSSLPPSRPTARSSTASRT